MCHLQTQVLYAYAFALGNNHRYQEQTWDSLLDDEIFMAQSSSAPQPTASQPTGTRMRPS